MRLLGRSRDAPTALLRKAKQLGRLYIYIVCFVCLPVLVQAQPASPAGPAESGASGERYLQGPFTSQEMERIKALKSSLVEVDQKTLEQTIHELEKGGHFRLNLQIREAMAKTYVDIVKEQKVEGKAKKEWLYSMIALNMAYFQFGGNQPARDTTPLNRLIRYKLKTYLPDGIFQRRGFHYSLE